MEKTISSEEKNSPDNVGSIVRAANKGVSEYTMNNNNTHMARQVKADTAQPR